MTSWRFIDLTVLAIGRRHRIRRKRPGRYLCMPTLLLVVDTDQADPRFGSPMTTFHVIEPNPPCYSTPRHPSLRDRYLRRQEIPSALQRTRSYTLTVLPDAIRSGWIGSWYFLPKPYVWVCGNGLIDVEKVHTRGAMPGEVTIAYSTERTLAFATNGRLLHRTHLDIRPEEHHEEDRLADQYSSWSARIRFSRSNQISRPNISLPPCPTEPRAVSFLCNIGAQSRPTTT
jgi:hypothetical protein